MKQASPVKPTIGRNIRYVLTQGIRRGEPKAAIVTQVWNGLPAYQHSEVNLTVFPDLANDEGAEKYATSVPYDPTGTEPGTWHWPADAGDGFPNPPYEEKQERPKSGFEPARPVIQIPKADDGTFPVFDGPLHIIGADLTVHAPQPASDAPAEAPQTTGEPLEESHQAEPASIGFTDLPSEPPQAPPADSTGDTPPADLADGSSAAATDDSGSTTGGDTAAAAD